MIKLGIISWTIVLGLIIAGIYIAIKRLFLPDMPQGTVRSFLARKIILIEKSYWAIFIISLGVSAILSQPIVGLSLCLFCTAVLWKPLHNYFLGLVYLAGQTYFVGQRIRYNDHLVTIKSFNNISLEMELDNGESMDVPYHDFAEAIVIRSSPKSGIISQHILLKIAKPCVLVKEENQIRATLLSLPWVLPRQKIIFERISEEVSHYNLKVTVHGLDKNHLDKVASRIKSMYQSTQEH